MIPVVSLGAGHRSQDVWRCEQCGVTKPATWRGAGGRLYHQRSKYCGGKCRGDAMRGKANPAYTVGNRTMPRPGRKRLAMTEWQVEAIQSWDRRGRQQPIQQLAELIGVTKRAIWKRLAAISARQQTKENAK